MPLPCEENAYLRKFGLRERAISDNADEGLGCVVVIPCFDEPDLTGALESLWLCDRPSRPVEIIVVVNDSEEAAPSARRQNLATLADLDSWSQERVTKGFRVHPMRSLGQTGKRAGVGFSRKLGMDEAIRRLNLAGTLDSGVIVCFDADCRCDRNYLREIEKHFADLPATPGCSIRFEHPLDQDSPEIVEAVAAYELHLRYYINALRHAGFPGAFQTVGSSMAVRPWAYQKVGGMNCRQAGEDFYFLHRVIELGGFTELSSTRVIPSPRPSHRVPFGTGRAVSGQLESSGEDFASYPIRAFTDLRELHRQAPGLRTMESEERHRSLAALASPLSDYLRRNSFPSELEKMIGETNSEETFRKRFHGWLNAFRILKFIHHARDTAYGEAPVRDAALALLHELGDLTFPDQSPDIRQLLERYRERDRLRSQ